MLRFASLMRSAIKRRKPITLISVVSAPSASVARGAPAAAPALETVAEFKSARNIRPPGPEPATVARSIPASLARRRFAGDVITRPERAIGVTTAPAGVALAADAAAAAGTARATGAAVGAAAGTAAASLNSNTINGEPTATLSPG